MSRERALIALAMLAAAVPAQAQEHRKRAEITPYIEASQVLDADLKSGDVLTYTSVAAGVDASVHSRRVEVQVDYRYEHRFAYQRNVGDDDVHSGLARADVAVSRSLHVEAGAIATRARSDIRGDAPVNLAGDVRNVSQVYSAYAGPSLATHAGPISLSANYRFGYTKAESPGATGVPAGQQPLDVYDSSTTHVANVSAGVRSGTVLPVGVTVAAAYEREDAHQLDQRYEGKHVRGDVVLPVGRGVALEAGGGYETIRISERAAKLDANGVPVTDANGRQVTDPSSPRKLAYDLDAVFWDAGVIYRPNRRFMLEARAGRRYGSMSYTGSLSWQMGRTSGLQIGVYDSIDSFGRQLGNSLSSLPTSFDTASDPFGNGYNGCIFGTVGSSAGGCLSGVFQSIPTANFRSRGVDGVFVANRGRLRLGLGAGYANRRYIAPRGGGFSVDGVTDQSWYGQFFASEELSERSQLSGNIFLSYYDPGLPGAPNILSTGANATYFHSFGRLGASASLGLYGFDQEGSDSAVSAQGLLGMRYQF